MSQKNKFLIFNFQLSTYIIMLHSRVEAALNAQINAEMWSAYLYLSMAAYCHNEGFTGMANWFQVQFKEEQDHAQILFNHVISRGGRVKLEPIDAVETEWASVLAVFENTLQHEKKVTMLINDLYSVALEEKDYAAQSMLKWFIDEQVEEEEGVQDILNHLRMVKDNGYGLYMIDKELGARTYTQASPLATSAE